MAILHGKQGLGYVVNINITVTVLPNTTVLNIQGLFEGYAVTVTEELEHLIFGMNFSIFCRLQIFKAVGRGPVGVAMADQIFGWRWKIAF